MSGGTEHSLREVTHLCRAWSIGRCDGTVLGFTDHDRDLTFDGISFRAGAGIIGVALAQTTGLSVDNSEATGALTSLGVSDEDIAAGRYDGAEVRAWTVPWDNLAARRLDFRGTIGTITRHGAEFRAELRGLTEQLNISQGRIFHSSCSAVLGDEDCGVDIGVDHLHSTGVIDSISEDGDITISLNTGFDDGWFARGTIFVESGPAKGLSGIIKVDHSLGTLRQITLWNPIGAEISPGEQVSLTAGCDKCLTSCETKFGNMVNYRGFPHIPGEDWLMSVPRRDEVNDGGSLSA